MLTPTVCHVIAFHYLVQDLNLASMIEVVSMSNKPFTIPFDDLPESLPIFPLPNAIVMPGCYLPLNIFEPRYVEMVLDALKESRLIGMIQPEVADKSGSPLYRTGTAGRIVSFNELPDGRFLVVLQGICRFDILSEISTDRAYRRVAVDWSRFREDYQIPHRESGINRSRLMDLLKNYFDRRGFQADWPAFDEIPDSLLVNMLAGQLPLAIPEKQALIEAVSPEERIFRFMHLLEFEAASSSTIESRLH